MVLEADTAWPQVLGLEDELMTIAAALTVQSPFLRVDPGSPAATLRQTFSSEEGDAFTLLNVFDEWIRVHTLNAELETPDPES